MTPAETEDVDDDLESKENGSDAVERRIEKIMFDMRDHGLIDVNDEKAYEEKKVKQLLLSVSLTNSLILFSFPIFLDGDLVGSVHCLFAGCV